MAHQCQFVVRGAADGPRSLQATKVDANLVILVAVIPFGCRDGNSFLGVVCDGFVRLGDGTDVVVNAIQLMLGDGV